VQFALTVPTIRDRVAQAAAKLVVEPIFEADLEANAYGYRPRRSAQDAVKEVHKLLLAGHTDVVDADLSKYFDTIPHDGLMKCVARRIVDRRVLHLIKMWLTAAAMEQDDHGNWRNLGSNQKGTPQGGVISPLLANLYMNRFLKYFREQGKGEQFRAAIISYADDFVILTKRSPGRSYAEAARSWTQQVMSALGLTLNEQKTSIRDSLEEDFHFLGYTFGPRYWWKTGKVYQAARPSGKSIQRLCQGVRTLLRSNAAAPWPEVRDRLNAKLRGWQNYFRYGSVARAYSDINRYVPARVRHFLRRRGKTASGTKGTRQFSDQNIFSLLGVHQLVRQHGPACAFV